MCFTDSMQNVVPCIIVSLLEKSFERRLAREKLMALCLERPQPDKLKVKKDGKALPSANMKHKYHTISYDDTDWLTGCEKLNKLFCWPCLFFSKDKDVWSTCGFDDLINLNECVLKHSKTEDHECAAFNYQTFHLRVTELASDLDKCVLGDARYSEVYGCQIENLFLVPFHQRSNNAKLAIFRSGRPTPKLANLIRLRTVKKHTRRRRFKTSWYERVPWLSGSDKLSKLYCWPCLLNKPETSPWSSKIGYNDLNNLHTAVKKHEGSRCHRASEMWYDEFNPKKGPSKVEPSRESEFVIENYDEVPEDSCSDSELPDSVPAGSDVQINERLSPDNIIIETPIARNIAAKKKRVASGTSPSRTKKCSKIKIKEEPMDESEVTAVANSPVSVHTSTTDHDRTAGGPQRPSWAAQFEMVNIKVEDDDMQLSSDAGDSLHMALHTSCQGGAATSLEEKEKATANMTLGPTSQDPPNMSSVTKQTTSRNTAVVLSGEPIRLAGAKKRKMHSVMKIKPA